MQKYSLKHLKEQTDIQKKCSEVKLYPVVQWTFFPHKGFSKFHTPLRTVNEQPWLTAFEHVTVIQFICLSISTL